MATGLCDVPIGRVEDELVALAGQLSAGTCRWLLLLAEFDRRGGWEGWGISSCVHWLSIRLAISPTTARAQLRVAHALSGLPVVTEHFAAGRLSYSQVRALCRVADSGNEAELVRLAQEMNADQLERMCRLLGGVDAAADAEAAVRTSMVTRWDDDGSATIRVRLPNEDVAAVLAAVEERVKKMDLPGQLGLDARRARALVEVVADGATVTTPVRERPLVHLVVPLADLDAARGGTVDGHPVADATVRRMLRDGAIVGVTLDGNGNPVSVGTKTRVPSPRIRRAVDVRDGRRCTYPGCGRPAEETHHILHWVDGHRTSADLLTSLCGHHHRAHHQGRCRIDIDPADGHARFTRPDGGPILTPAATSGTAPAFQAAFPLAPGTVPSRWDGSPLLASELIPPRKEHAEPTTVRFGSHRTPKATATRLARTLGGRFEQEGDVWVTSSPELITITPEPAGGSLVTIELTTRPHDLTTTLITIGLHHVPAPAEQPLRRRRLTRSATGGGASDGTASDGSAPAAHDAGGVNETEKALGAGCRVPGQGEAGPRPGRSALGVVSCCAEPVPNRSASDGRAPGRPAGRHRRSHQTRLRAPASISQAVPGRGLVVVRTSSFGQLTVGEGKRATSWS